MNVTRTQGQIVARIEEIAEEDAFGWSRELLIDYLDFEHAKPWLNEDVTAGQWEAAQTKHGSLEVLARGYLAFAIDKINDERGISASRSVDKLTHMAWLAGRDDIVTAMDAAGYEPYGEPKVQAFADGMGWPWLYGAELDAAVKAYWSGGAP